MKGGYMEIGKKVPGGGEKRALSGFVK